MGRCRPSTTKRGRLSCQHGRGAGHVHPRRIIAAQTGHARGARVIAWRFGCPEDLTSAEPPAGSARATCCGRGRSASCSRRHALASLRSCGRTLPATDLQLARGARSSKLASATAARASASPSRRTPRRQGKPRRALTVGGMASPLPRATRHSRNDGGRPMGRPPQRLARTRRVYAAGRPRLPPDAFVGPALYLPLADMVTCRTSPLRRWQRPAPSFLR